MITVLNVKKDYLEDPKLTMLDMNESKLIFVRKSYETAESFVLIETNEDCIIGTSKENAQTFNNFQEVKFALAGSINDADSVSFVLNRTFLEPKTVLVISRFKERREGFYGILYIYHKQEENKAAVFSTNVIETVEDFYCLFRLIEKIHETFHTKLQSTNPTQNIVNIEDDGEIFGGKI